MSKIEINHVSLDYKNQNETVRVLEDINLKIEEGEFVCIIGPSGCGKSTLISLIAGLKFPTKGNIKIDGKVVKSPGIDRGIVFQNYSLFPWLTAKNNVTFGIKQAKILSKRNEIEDRAITFLNKVGLGEYINKYPYELSGGMQQRVAIARTLAMDTDILLMDEPFGALDPKKRYELQDLTIELCKNIQNRKVVIFVTHDIDEAIVLADRILFMTPKHISKEIKVNLSSDLPRSELVRLKEYEYLRKLLINLFYGETSKGIGGENVAL